MNLSLSLEAGGWYFSASGELRSCIVATAAGVVRVIDSETLLVLEIDPKDVMVERPEP